MPHMPNRRRAWLAGLCTAAVLGALVCAVPALVEADIKVNAKKDVVVLKDGTRLEGIILAETADKVMIAVNDPQKPEASIQKIVRKTDVKEIIRGEAQEQPVGFQTGPEQGLLVIQGRGFRQPVVEEKKAEAPATVGPIAPVTPVQPAVLPNPDARAGGLRPSNTKLNPQEIADVYVARFPALRELSEVLPGGLTVLPKLIQGAAGGDPTARDQWQEILELCLHAEGRGPGARPEPLRPGQPKKPAGPVRVRPTPEAKPVE